jgi:thiamine-monophosphate kinase
MAAACDIDIGRTVNLHQTGEFGLIEQLSAGLRQRDKVLLGIGDDAAILAALQCPVVTCDALLEGVHFRRDWTTARDLGWKALAVNLSDIAAMGAQPVAAFITLALDAATTLEWVQELYAGMEAAAAEFQFTIAGGDTVRSLQQVALSVTIIGEVVPPRRPLRRDGARPGDLLMVTGTLGDAAAGLALLQNSSLDGSNRAEQSVLQRHFRPTPRLREIDKVLSLCPDAVTAALDLSDGLAGDAGHLARRSNVAVEIDVPALPISQACREVGLSQRIEPAEWALRGGEDYELLLAICPEAASRVLEVLQATGTGARIIGRCRENDPTAAPVMLRHADGRCAAAHGAWSHF